ncbi:MAG: radical SAM protein [Thermodesulfobacteriota bacterium]
MRKRWTGRLPVALVYPNQYTLGMSSLGFQLVYALANELPEVACERVFLPAAGQRPRSVESGRELAEFAVVLVSISFEQDLPNLVRLLAAAGLPPLARERQDRAWPLVVAGGVATFINPEPLAPFVDLMLLGEAEALLPSFFAQLLAAGNAGREALVFRLAQELPGCYAPRFYQPRTDSDGTFLGFEVTAGLPAQVQRQTSPAPATAGHSRLFSPEAAFANMYAVELGRGCSRGCRFCAAGFVYRPPRPWPSPAIAAALAARPPEIVRLGLLGMEMIPAAELATLAGALAGTGCRLSFSSLRADALSPALLDLVAAGQAKTVAIAPDAASERLRRVINKGLAAADILAAAEALADRGVRSLKLYLMIGLPTETEEDLREWLDLVRQLRERLLAVGRRRGRMTTLVLSVNPFVPKAWTPFQWEAMAPPPVLRQRLAWLRQHLAGLGNLRLDAETPASCLLQGVLARADRRLGEAIALGMDRPGGWRRACQEAGLSPAAAALRERGEDEAFPWEVVRQGVSRQYLWAERQRARAGQATPPCQPARCRACGVCREG